MYIYSFCLKRGGGGKPSCKIQNSKFARGERPNFEFLILRRRVSIVVGRRRRVVTVVTVVAARALLPSL